MKAIICDRCKMPLPQPGMFLRAYEIRLHRVKDDFVVEDEYKVVDLCRDCFSNFLNYTEQKEMLTQLGK